MLHLETIFVDTGLLLFAHAYLALLATCLTVVVARRRRHGQPLSRSDDDRLLGTLIRASFLVLISILIVCDGVLGLARLGDVIGAPWLGQLAGLLWVMGLATVVMCGRYPGTLVFASTRVIAAPARRVWDTVRTRETDSYFDPAVVRVERLGPNGQDGGDVYSFHHQIGNTQHRMRHQVIEVIEGRTQRSRLTLEEMIGEFSFNDVIGRYEVVIGLEPRGPKATRVECLHRVTNASVLMILTFLAVNAPRRMLHVLAAHFERVPATTAATGGTRVPGSRAD